MLPLCEFRFSFHSLCRNYTIYVVLVSPKKQLIERFFLELERGMGQLYEVVQFTESLITL
jgi:hypothetical protein